MRRRRDQTPLPPGSVIGILGGGQLGRMIAMAAASLGYATHVYAPEKRAVAADVAGRHTRAAYDDMAALTAFAESCDVVTYEFENVPTGPLNALACPTPIHPPPAALEIAQDRLAEKNFARDAGAATARFAGVATRAELDAAVAKVGLPLLLKTVRMGYDGKGQALIRNADEAAAAWEELGGKPCIAEQLMEFGHEFSVIMARGVDGAVAFWPSPRNAHDDGILARSTLPAPAAVEAQQDEARALTRAIGAALDYVGVLTIEFFACGAGPVFNEMAPRVHNSGHWTIEGAVTSQFENHVRAIAGLPLGATDPTGRRVEMVNIIGDAAPDLSDPAAKLHLYGKRVARAGRKMGHVTRVWR